MVQENTFYATGKRKSSIARTWIKPGTGVITVNGRTAEDYFPLETVRTEMSRPFALTETLGAYDVWCTVKGGGISGQAGAVRHGITKALMLANPEFRGVLKRAGYVKRDPRVKERKKYGQKGARGRFQFSKR